MSKKTGWRLGLNKLILKNLLIVDVCRQSTDINALRWCLSTSTDINAVLYHCGHAFDLRQLSQTTACFDALTDLSESSTNEHVHSATLYDPKWQQDIQLKDSKVPCLAPTRDPNSTWFYIVSVIHQSRQVKGMIGSHWGMRPTIVQSPMLVTG